MKPSEYNSLRQSRPDLKLPALDEMSFWDVDSVESTSAEDLVVKIVACKLVGDIYWDCELPPF